MRDLGPSGLAFTFSAIVSLLLVAGCDGLVLWLIGFSGLGSGGAGWLLEFDSSLLPGCVSGGESAGGRGRMMGPEGK